MSDVPYWCLDSSDEEDHDRSLDSEEEIFMEQASATLSAIFNTAREAEARGIDLYALFGVQPRDPAPDPAEDESQDQV
jgi:hypothetical protein